MRMLAILLITSPLAACAGGAPVSPQQRAQAQYDTPRDHPHPPARLVGSAAADPSFDQLRCWNNAPEIVCSRSP